MMKISTLALEQSSTVETNTILDHVEDAGKRIETKFLEPACGDSAILSKVLVTKLNTLNGLHNIDRKQYEKMSVMAVSSLYGIERLKEKVLYCRKNLLSVYEDMCGDYVSEGTKSSVRYILERNIICGDMLTMEENSGLPIIISEWMFSSGSYVIRMDYRLQDVLDGDKDPFFYFEPVRYDEIRISVPLMGE